MARYDRLIGFLEQEAHVLRDRIRTLKEREMHIGVTTGDGDPDPVEGMRRDAEVKLAEIEGHLSDLRWWKREHS
jgi:hypothetical protein